MFHDLPRSVQHEIQYHLANQDLESAKLVHDHWMMKNHHQITDKKPSEVARPLMDYQDLF